MKEHNISLLLIDIIWLEWNVGLINKTVGKLVKFIATDFHYRPLASARGFFLDLFK